MSLSILLDVVLAIILLVFLIRGLRRGAVAALSHIVSLLCALFGAGWVARHYSARLGEEVFLARIEGKLVDAQSSLGLPDLSSLTDFSSISEALSELLGAVKLPDFLTSDIAQDLIQSISGIQSDIIGTTAAVLAQKLAFIVLFIVSFIVILIVVRLIFLLLKAATQVPGVRAFNSILGGILNLLAACVVITVLLWLICTFFPDSRAVGGLLSDAVVEKTYLTKWFFTHTLSFLP